MVIQPSKKSSNTPEQSAMPKYQLCRDGRPWQGDQGHPRSRPARTKPSAASRKWACSPPRSSRSTRRPKAARRAKKAGRQAGQGRQKGRGDQHQHQDPRPERPGQIQGPHHLHPPVGHPGGCRPAALARFARARKAGAKRHPQEHYRRTGRCPSKAAAPSPRAWPSIPRSSTASSSTWSRPAKWAACSKSS